MRKQNLGCIREKAEAPWLFQTDSLEDNSHVGSQTQSLKIPKIWERGAWEGPLGGSPLLSRQMYAH